MAKQNTLHSIHVQRNDTAANWAEANPVLLKGEMGVEIDTRKFKFGDGTKHWNELEYVSKDLEDAVATEQARAEKAETALGDRITAEQARAEKAESDLGQRIDDEQGRAEEAEAGLEQKITEETARAEGAESGLSERITAATVDIDKIRNLLKGGSSLDDTKTALLALGENYKDLYAVANTLHTFLDLSDTADTAINRWQEIEAFLADITDTSTLTGLLDALKIAITEAYKAAITEAETRERTRATGVEQGLDTRLKAAEGEIGNMKSSFDGKVNGIIDQRFSGDVFILEGGDATGWSMPE